MKALLFIDTLGSGGAQRQLVNLGVGLKDKGHDVTFLTYNKPFHFKNILEDNKIRHHHIQKRGKLGFHLLFEINQFIKKEDFDVCYSFLQMPAFYLLAGKCLFGIKKTKLTVSERCFEGHMTFANRLFRVFYRYADFITANSITQTEILKSKKPDLAHKIKYIPNGLDLKKLDFSPNVFSEGLLKLVSVGRITRVKNVKFLVEVVHVLVNKHNLNVQMTWVGREPEENLVNDRKYYDECKDLIKSYSLENNWIWRGEVNQVEKEYYQNHLLIHPSIGEGFPNVVCEGMSTGITVFASDVCDHPLIIKNGENGYLFSLDNVANLTESITSYLSSREEEKVNILKQARTMAETKFALETMVSSYLELTQQ